MNEYKWPTLAPAFSISACFSLDRLTFTRADGGVRHNLGNIVGCLAGEIRGLSGLLMRGFSCWLPRLFPGGL